MKLTHCTTVTSLQRLQRKSISKILRQSKDYNQSKIKTYQKAKAIYCVSKFCTKKKQKKKPQYKLYTKTEKIKNPIVVVAVAKLARRRRRLTVARCSLQREQIAVVIVIADRSAQLVASASPLAVAVGVSENLPSDPGLRQKISSYHPNNHDEIRRHYLTKGPCQPVLDVFPVSYFSEKPRRFRSDWYRGRKWLKYSIEKDAAFCFYCYLFGRQDNQVAKLDSHVGGVNSAHSQAVKKGEDLLMEKQHIQSVLVKQSNKDKQDYRVQLNAIVDCIRFLLCRGLAFRGHDESQDHNESINEVLQTAPKICKLTHLEIQKDIVNAIASETSKAIIKDIDNEFFSILVDESRDISVKEQMSLVFRYVNKKGTIIERFLSIVHVASTIALSLKCAIECLLCEHNLSLSNLRGQGYDGASNMQGDINGLKTLILKENKSAFYVHCFAHQLQLTLVAIAKNHINIAEFFYVVSNLVTVVGGSCKRRDALRDAQFVKIKKDLENGVRRSGQGLNQEINLKRPGDTQDGLSGQKVEARSIIRSILSFEFDIVNAMDLVKVFKQRLQVMREDEWESLLTETNLHHYRVELFYTVIDMQLQELNNRFSEANTDLLLCMACLNPSNSFVAFDKEKLIRLAKFYPFDFLRTDILALDSQLQNYIFDMRSNDFFLELQGVSELAEKLVSTRKHETYPLVYLLVKLALTLPVATTTVERSFSVMKYIKNELRNRMGDRWMNNCLMVYIEKDVACSIDNETIIQRFQNMKTRRRQL
ncbi:hypothetical protein RGQ29_008794 [Quercus rubra]|uniref:TTF-type domain-containing protein n=1 Tax=Quercus rubra TaxID=3512 RepID=A0AAN7I9C6_QUERU|nr:hypothetical protein RGQ29_008794 [Quercus rubra]